MIRLHGDWTGGGHLEMDVADESDAAKWSQKLESAMSDARRESVTWTTKTERNGDTSIAVSKP